MLRKLICWTMIVMFPAALMASDSGAAMLHARGAAWLNGGTVPSSSAIFPGDLVQTQANSVVNINSAGSSVTVLSDSLVKYEGNAVSVEHGRVTVATSKGMATRLGDVTVAPVSNAWTEFEVTDVDGKVQVVARKGDVSISDGGQSNTLPEGQQATRDESNQHKRDKRRAGAAAPAGEGGWLDSPWVIGGTLGAMGGVAVWLILEDQEPFSPSKP